MWCATGTFCISDSTFKRVVYQTLLSFVFLGSTLPVRANLEGNDWIFHAPDKDYVFRRAGELSGSPLVQLRELCEKLGLEFTLEKESKKLTLRNPQNNKSAQLSTEDRKVSTFFGGVELSRAPIAIKEQILVPIDIGDRVVRPLLTGEKPLLPKARSDIFQTDIVLDPGHGGNDFGAHFKIEKMLVKEKDLTLQIAKELKKVLEAEKLRVVLTREDDTYLTLHERTSMANRIGARFFLSLHLNSDPKKRSRGYEIFLLSLTQGEEKIRNYVARENQTIPADLPPGVEKAIADLKAESNLEHSLVWAKTVAGAFQSHLPSFGRPVKMGPFYVLYGANMPAVLAEVGFISDERDRVLYRSPIARAKVLKELASRLAIELKKGIVAHP